MKRLLTWAKSPAPTWWERDGDVFVEVCGCSVIESLVAFLAGTVVIAAAIAVLAVMP